MKNLILYLVILSTGSSFAQEVELFEGEVRNILSMVDNMEESISTTPQTTTALDLSDYQQVREAFLQRVSVESSVFRSCLGEIAESGQSQVSRLEQEIHDLVVENRRRRSRVFARLIRDKHEALDNLKTRLKEELGDVYRRCIRQFISLGGHIQIAYSVETTSELRRRRLLHLIPVVGTLLIELQVVSNGEYPFVMRGFLGDVMREYPRFIGRTRWTLERHDRTSSNIHHLRRMTEGCETDACRYLVIADILSWIEQAIEVNNDLEVMDGIELEELDLPDWNRRFMRRLRRRLREASRRYY